MKYWRKDDSFKTKFGSGTRPKFEERFRINITREEWRHLHSLMSYNLHESESDPRGHLFLHVEGRRRTWVVGDGVQIVASELEGLEPLMGDGQGRPLDVLVNSRFFRSCDAEDCTLLVGQQGGVAVQTLRRNGMDMTVPAPKGEPPNWEGVLSRRSGTEIVVEGTVLLEACSLISLTPSAGNDQSEVPTWLVVRNGRLIMESAGGCAPPTRLEIEILNRAADTEPFLVDIRRLGWLVVPIETTRVTLDLPKTNRGILGVASGEYRSALQPMDREAPIRDHVGELMLKIPAVTSVKPDFDGDYSVKTRRGHQLWVRLYGSAEPMCIQVFSVLATDVHKSAGLMEELNSINASSGYVKVMWMEGGVIAEVEMVAGQLTLNELSNAVLAVDDAAEKYVTVLGAWFSANDDEEGVGE